MEIKVQLDGVKEALELFSPRLVKAAMKSTMVKLASGTRTRIDQKIREGYNIKRSDLMKAIRIKPVTNPMEAELIIQDEDPKRPPGIFKFGGRAAVQTPEGTWIEVRKGKGVRVISQAFIANMPSGHKGVFIRLRGGKGKGGRVARMPIREIYGPRITSLVADDIIQRTIQQYLDDKSQGIFDHEIEARWKGYTK